MKDDYLLGTHDAEIERLGIQHVAWRSHATATWRRAGFRPGQTLLDVGCGPGYATLDLAQLVGSGGRVLAVDGSRRFLDHLRDRCEAVGASNVSLFHADLDDGLPVPPVEGAWCRWVAAFVRDPQRLVARIAARLAPGGTVAFHEYSEYRSWRMLPDLPELDRFVEVVMQAWRQEGGEPDVGRSLPRWLEAEGLEVVRVRPIVEVVTPQDLMWQWPKAFIRSGALRLQALGAMDSAAVARLATAFTEAEAAEAPRMVTPAVLEVIARRR